MNEYRIIVLLKTEEDYEGVICIINDEWAILEGESIFIESIEQVRDNK